MKTRLDGERTVTCRACQRVSVAAGRAVCLTRRRSGLDGFDAVLLDRRLRQIRRVPAPGTANRARLAPDGRRVAWTGFVTGRDISRWRARTLRRNAECPSLSPDGTRLAFKKRVSATGARPWQLHVLDLTTMRETPLPGTRGVDDQATWLDNHTILYAMLRSGGSDIWSAPADAQHKPHLLLPNASSPAPTR